MDSLTYGIDKFHESSEVLSRETIFKCSQFPNTLLKFYHNSLSTQETL